MRESTKIRKLMETLEACDTKILFMEAEKAALATVLRMLVEATAPCDCGKDDCAVCHAVTVLSCLAEEY